MTCCAVQCGATTTNKSKSFHFGFLKVLFTCLTKIYFDHQPSGKLPCQIILAGPYEERQLLIDSASDLGQKRHLEVIVCIIESFNSRLQRYSLCTVYKLVKVTDLVHIRPCGLMDKAPDFGSGDCRFESCHGRFLF